MRQLIVERSATGRNIETEIRTVTFEAPPHSATHCDDRCFISVSLGPRPPGARARFDEIWEEPRYEPVGDITFVPAGLTMIGTCDAVPFRYMACHIDADLFGLDWHDLGETACLESLKLGSPEAMRGLRRIYRETADPSLASPLALEAAAILVAVDIQRRIRRVNRPPQRKRGGLTPARLRRIEARLNADLPLPTLAELAGECELSVRHLARAFREETGRTLGAHVTDAGRRRAFALLQHTDLPIRQIARQAGFASPASFAYAFRRATGQTPGQARRRKPIGAPPASFDA